MMDTIDLYNIVVRRDIRFKHESPEVTDFLAKLNVPDEGSPTQILFACLVAMLMRIEKLEKER